MKSMDKVFLKLQQLDQFLKIEKKDSAGFIHTCKHCDYKNPKKHNLWVHNNKYHIENNKQTLACNECDYTTNNKEYLGNHKRQKHWGVKHKCTECDYSHNLPSKIKTHHQQIHLGIRRNQKSKWCRSKACEKQIESTCTNENHRYFGCDQCNFSTRRNDTLSFHITKDHDGIIHPCQFCDYKTAHKSNLK